MAVQVNNSSEKQTWQIVCGYLFSINPIFFLSYLPEWPYKIVDFKSFNQKQIVAETK